MAPTDSGIFDSVRVINLASNVNRLEQFYRDLPKDWSFLWPERFDAIDGCKVTPPPHFQGNRGIWGCFRSHYRLLEEVLNSDVSSLLVLEDDAVCVPDFTKRAAKFLEALPPDAEFIYFGGQHIELEQGLPLKINELVYRPYNAHRSHAYALRGRKAMERVFHHLNSPQDWRRGNSIDHRYGELHKNYPGGVYVPANWLIGQRAGYSSIQKRQMPTQFFPSAAQLLKAPIDKKIVAVVGQGERSSDLVAAALHVLGIPMGQNSAPLGTIPQNLRQAIAPGFHQLMHQLYSELWWEPLVGFEHRVALMRRWASRRRGMRQGLAVRYLGASLPILSAIPREVFAAWDDPVVVLVERSPSEESNTKHEQTGHGIIRARKADAGISEYENTPFHTLIRIRPSEFQSTDSLVAHLCSMFAMSPSVRQVGAATALLHDLFA